MRRAVLQRRDRATHLAGMARHIDDGVELFAGERRKAVRFITVHADQAARRPRPRRDAARRTDHVMASAGVDRNCPPKKLRAAEDQQAHACTLRPVSSSIAGSVRATGSAVKRLDLRACALRMRLRTPQDGSAWQQRTARQSLRGMRARCSSTAPWSPSASSSSGPRQRDPVHRRPERLRQDHVAALHRRPDRSQRRRAPGRRQAGRRPPPEGVAMVFQHFGLLPWKTVYDNAAFGLAMAQRAARARSRSASGISRAGRPEGLRAALSLSALGRHAAARRPGARAGDEPVDPADGRAVRRARRADARDPAGGAAALMERPDERKTMVFITHSIDEAILLGDRIAVMTARPGRIKEMLDMPFGGRATSMRCAPIRASPSCVPHIWHQLHTARPSATREGGRVTRSTDPAPSSATPQRRAADDRARAERAAAAPPPHAAQSRHPRRVARDRAGAVADRRRGHRSRAVHDAERRSRSPPSA